MFTTKIKLIITGIIILLSGIAVTTIVIQNNILKSYKQKYENAQFNFENADFKLDSVKTKYGVMVYSVNQLNIKNSELGKVNQSLVEKVKEMELKIKNLQGLTTIEYVYLFKTDTVYIYKLQENDSIQIFYATYKDNYINVGEYLKYDRINCDVSIDSLSIISTGEIITAYETIYERKFLCKKPVGVKVHVSTGKNPYLKINRIETYRFRKNDKKIQQQ